MIKLKVMSWHNARDHVLKEIELNTEAIYNITHFLVDFTADIKEIIKLLELSEKEETTIKDIPQFSKPLFMRMELLILIIPGLPILYPTSDWENLINSILSLLDNYSGVYQTVAIETHDSALAKTIYEIKNKLISCGKNIEFGATVENLVPVLGTVLNRLEYIYTVNPYALELSKEYLRSLNMPINDSICT